MNPDLRFIFSRRSVRVFQDKAVPEALIEDLLRAAMAAPSAVAKDPWHFIVIRDRKRLERLADVLPNAPMLRHAPAAIVAAGDIRLAHDREESYLLQDVSAAVENILLAATALGLGSCWLGVHPRKPRMDGIRGMFQLPPSIVPVAGIALAYPAESPEARTRYNPERIHREDW